MSYVLKVEVGESIDSSFKNIFDIDYKVEKIKNAFSIEVNETKFNGFNLNFTNQNFETQEQELVFHFNSKDFSSDLLFLQKQNLVFKITKFNNEEFYFYGTFKGKEVDYFYNTGFVKVKYLILQSTPFIKIKKYDFEIDNQEEIIGTPFPIEFPYQFTGVGNTYENSVFTITSKSKLISQAKFTIETLGNPIIRIGSEDVENLNAYVSTNFIIPLNNKVVLSSFFPEKQISLLSATNEIQNIEQNREFKYKTFLDFESGETNLYCNNISRLGVDLYELHATF